MEAGGGWGRPIPPAKSCSSSKAESCRMLDAEDFRSWGRLVNGLSCVPVCLSNFDSSKRRDVKKKWSCKTEVNSPANAATQSVSSGTEHTRCESSETNQVEWLWRQQHGEGGPPGGLSIQNNRFVVTVTVAEKADGAACKLRHLRGALPLFAATPRSTYFFAR